ncbi:tetratricopeptide repeat protein 17-like isoform X2 [Liolophura sinensis]|uniref:tetratricopeptide repeat protein 17-like isoform X2 n=1 Tax=Liolophura sinensis TaxID=3198878 RepID=UPI0031594085
MAAAITVLLWLKFVLELCRFCDCSSHWIVTEDGRIQAQLDTVFNMRRPYDLVAFMKQDERARTLSGLKNELLSRKDEIDKNEDKDTGLEQRFYKTDSDCVSAGKALPEFDLYISTVLPLENKGIRPEEHIDIKAPPSAIPIPPDCTAVMDLDYSFHAFEHLEGMKDRENLTGTPELGLKNAITHRDNVDDYGHLIYEAMKKNKTSWVLYNMAAFYWRIKGDSYNVIECLRRALHYSPRMQKDVALISLANVLHRARYSNEAAIVVHAALDVSKELNVNHFTLGNIYAVLGEYNKSVICFENTLKIQPDFDAAAKRKHAVLCHAKLESALEAQHRSLQRTLNDLKDYQKKHDHWQQENDRLLTEQVMSGVKMEQRLAYEQLKSRDSSSGVGEHCLMGEKDGRQVLTCTWKKQRSPDLDFSALFEGVSSSLYNPQTRGTGDGPKKKSLDYSKPVRAPLYTKHRREAPKFGDPSADWPSKEECDTFVQKAPTAMELPSVYLSPENKGFEVKALLSEEQNLKPGAQHALPWYPPACVPIMDLTEGSTVSYDHLKSISIEERGKMPLKLPDKGVLSALLNHINGGSVTEEEVGQRILTALKQNIGPSWVLFNLAGLYWRVAGNGFQGVECIRRALHTVPEQYRDVPLVNLANVLYRWGRHDDAVVVMQEALRINDLEPASHFLFGHLLWSKGNYTGAVWHYEQTLRSDPDSQEAFSTLRAIKCFQKYHQAAQSAAPRETVSKPVDSNCNHKGGGNPSSQQTESRVICKTENGEEKCIIETRTRTKMPECNGHCTQTCTITPIKLDSCGSMAGEITLDDGKSETNSCGPKGPNQPYASSLGLEDSFFTAEFAGKLDEHGTQKPHIKLDYVNGVLHQKLIFVDSPNDIQVEAHECMIYNDGSRSTGCSQEEFQTYQDELEHIQEEISELLNLNNFHCYQESASPAPAPEQTHTPAVQAASGNTRETPQEESPLPDQSNEPKQPEVNDGMKRSWTAHDIPDTQLPNTRIHIKHRFHLAMPSFEKCQTLSLIDFTLFSSTWLSVTAKQINLSDFLDFDTVLKRDFEEPSCKTGVLRVPSIDHLPGVANSNLLEYSPETGLTEVLQRLGGEPQPGQVMATRISHAIKKNANSWVLANLAALYWRIEGDARRAVDCLRVAISTAPHEHKDIALISLANVLHKTGRLNEAIIVTNMALEIANKLVVTHFTMANLYAAKAQWDKATMFYESTLGLQSNFEPAKQRLISIQCMRILKNPQYFKQEKSAKPND